MQEIKDDILKRTSEMKSLCLATEVTANQTIIILANQDEQLQDIKSHLTSIDATLADTQHNINRLKGITHRVIDSFRTKFHRRIFSKIMLHSTRKQNSFSTCSPSSSSLSRRRRSTPPVIQQNISPAKTFIDGQVDDTLYDIENVIHRLKGIAIGMNERLIGQADTISYIHENMIKSTVNIEKQSADIKKIP